MSDVAKKFVDSWISDNVHPTTYEPEGDNKGAAHLAAACWLEADGAGISRASIEAAVGPLMDYMAQAIERANDAEVRRLAAKDD